jgi:hypothetical protein
MTLSIIELRIVTLCNKTRIIVAFSITAISFRIMTFCMTTQSIMTFSITALRMTVHSMSTLIIMTIMVIVIMFC